MSERNSTIGKFLAALMIALVLAFAIPALRKANANGLNAVCTGSLVGENDGDLFGYPVAFLGDVNADGFKDFAVGANGFSTATASGTGKVYIYSGKDCTTIRTHIGTIANGLYGSVMSGIGDVNGDGYADYAIMDPNWSNPVSPWGLIQDMVGRIYAYSGKDGSILWTYTGTTPFEFQFGNSVMTLTGDFNGDGKPDLAVGAPGLSTNANQAGAILVLSAANGTLINKYDGTIDHHYVGVSFDSGYDLNGDGKQDFLVGDQFQTVSGQFYAGSAYVISGADFSTKLLTLSGVAQRYGFFGIFTKFAGDANKDGKVDLGVTSREDVGSNPGAGAIYLFSGADGSQLAKFTGNQPNESFGTSLDSAGDVNNDGYADITESGLNATFNSNAGAGQINVYSGKTTSTWAIVGGGGVGEEIGSSIAAGVDINGDGEVDELLGSPGGGQGGLVQGRARLELGDQDWTPAGTNVEVHPQIGRMNDVITFSSVTTSGDTTSTYNGSTQGASNFKTSQGSGAEFWTVTSTAVWSGNITVCVVFNPALYSNVSQISFEHLVSGTFSTIAGSTINTTTNTACGTVTSL